ncbi:MAG: DNA translocase FtsK [Alphaproteobacteria bacterium]|nr:DNA translocase FtsK [Alphaproteobacteria bacterium]
MESRKRFLPESFSVALKHGLTRIAGVVLVLVGLWAVLALFFHNPYLDGWATASTFGNQSIMGNIVGFLRYGVGFVPTLFIFLCVIRWGIACLVGDIDTFAPEYNFLRTFIALCIGSAGIGMVVPKSSFGGMLGFIAASDVYSLIGNWCVLVGALLLVGFCLLAGALLNIKWDNIVSIGRKVWRVIRWILAAFHIVAPIEVEEEEAEEEYEEEETDEEVEEEEKTKKKSRRRVVPMAVSCAMAEDFQLPDPRFLQKSVFGKNIVTPELKRTAELMEANFENYGVVGKVTGIRPGPIVTLYEFMPQDGVRMADISKTVTDMVRAMATEKIRIAHIPRTQLIGVEMVNMSPQTVRYQTLIDNEFFINSKFRIPLALGVDIGGNPMYYDLAKMPHMLIAGRTGSGKSVFVQSIITSIVYHFTPDKCKLIIIDPKGVDFGFWDDIPHLITPIVKLDAAAAVNVLKWAVREMEERYKQLQVLNARNIESYNEIAAEKRESGETVTRQVPVGTDEETGELLFEEQEVDLSDMPYIVIIIDEVADLMSLARKEVEACVQRIAQKARAAGIHLVMATQRPDATTITGVIKANFPTRVSFQARSVIDSMTTLGEKGAEQLLACGDMLFSEAGRIPVRIHGAFISDDELTKVGNFLRKQCSPDYVSGVTESEESIAVGNGAGVDANNSKEAKNADLYIQAKEIILRDKKPTISYLQRRLGVGYNKAASFMEKMEQEGIVSAPDANNKRHIL